MPKNAIRNAFRAQNRTVKPACAGQNPAKYTGQPGKKLRKT
jgi:hypothetical protein